MRFGFGFDRQFGFGPSASGKNIAPTELFPDPTLADTGNGTLWVANSAAVAPANLGAGPDILVTAADLNNDDFIELTGSYKTALAAVWVNSQAKTVQITASSVTAAGSVNIRFRDGTNVVFAISNTSPVSHTVTAGSDPNGAFTISGPNGSDGGIFTLTAVSVT